MSIVRKATGWVSRIAGASTAGSDALARGGAWALFGTLASRAFALFTSVVVARLLGKEGFGQLAIVLSTTVMFETFAGLGLSLTATRYVAQLRRSDPRRAGGVIALLRRTAIAAGALGSVALLLAAPHLASRVLAAPELTLALRISAAVLLISTLNAVESGTLAGLDAFPKLAKLNVAAGLVSVPLILAGVALHGIEGAAAANAVALGISWVLYRRAVGRERAAHGIPLADEGAKGELAILWSFSIPAYFSGLLVAPVNWLCSAMLVQEPSGYAELGAFNATNQWFNALMVLPGALGQVFLPALSRELASGDIAVTRRLLVQMIRGSAAIVAVPALLGILASPLIMRMYGAGFAEEWPTLAIALATAAIIAVQAPVGYVIAASGRMWTGFWMNLGWSVALLVLTWALVRQGAMGLALGRLGAYIIHSSWTFWFAYRVVAPPRGGDGNQSDKAAVDLSGRAGCAGDAKNS